VTSLEKRSGSEERGIDRPSERVRAGSNPIPSSTGNRVRVVIDRSTTPEAVEDGKCSELDASTSDPDLLHPNCSDASS